MDLHGLFLFAAGLALLVVGAEFVIRGASRLALSLGVKPLILGITVVAIGTSAPELAVGITAAMQAAAIWRSAISPERTSSTSCSFWGLAR